MAIDQHARARRAWPILARRALEHGQPFTYGELCGQLGLHHRAAAWFLGVIQTHCDLAGLPALQALAVNKKTRVPGVGYVGSHRTHVEHAKELHKVHAHKWSLVAPSKFRT